MQIQAMQPAVAPLFVSLIAHTDSILVETQAGCTGGAKRRGGRLAYNKQKASSGAINLIALSKRVILNRSLLIKIIKQENVEAKPATAFKTEKQLVSDRSSIVNLQ